ncbi:hypothetical protein RYX36_008297 [Vicia faba]
MFKGKVISRSNGKNTVEENKLANLFKHHFKHVGDMEGPSRNQQGSDDSVPKEGFFKSGFHSERDPKQSKPLDLQGMGTRDGVSQNKSGDSTNVGTAQDCEELEKMDFVAETPVGNQ